MTNLSKPASIEAKPLGGNKLDVEKLTKQPAEKLSELFGSLEISSVSNLPDNFNMLIYGNAGVGKTTLAVSMYEVKDASPVLLVDMESGSSVLKKINPPDEKVKVATVTEWEQLKTIYRGLKAKGSPFKTVVVDTITEAQKLCVKRILDESTKEKETPELRDYLLRNDRMLKFMRMFRDLPINTVFTAHAFKPGTEENLQHSTIMPFLAEKLSIDVVGNVDIVFYMTSRMKEGKREVGVLSDPTPSYFAKNRLNSLEEVEVNPTMKDIYPRLLGKE